jgi:transcription antitermination protein NusB
VTSRREARRTAIDILYQADVTGEDPKAVLGGWTDAGRAMTPFTEELVAGVREHRPEIDDLLDRHSEGWAVDRMAVLDRTILRVAVFELLHRPDVPPSAAISEAVQAASELSAEASSRFVNGILGRIAGDLRPPADDDGA